MGIFNEKSEFYKKKTIHHYKGPIFKWLIFTIFTIIQLIIKIKYDNVKSFTLSDLSVIFIPLSILWGFILIIGVKNYLKKLKKKYYPNGQLKYKIKVPIRFHHRTGSKTKPIPTTKTTWYQNGQLKSETHYFPEYSGDDIIVSSKSWDENGKEITSEPNKGTSSKSKKVENKKSNFGTQYYDLEETLLGKNSSYNEEYGFIKSLREKLKSGEVYLEDMSGYIKNHHKKYDGGEIMTKTELYNQLEHIFTVYLEDWEKKKETTFVGFEDVEQYHSLSQKIVVELGDLLQEKIMELGK